ncbi:MAG: family transcriptional regulator [Rhodoglobus sp.]|nr:family transcriptional regulator [Rhodoglobus sp.]
MTGVIAVDDTTGAGVRPTLELLRAASPAAVDVFTCILTRGPISRIDIARHTGLSQAAVTKAVAPLIAAGVVSDNHETHNQDTHRGSSPGRPANPLRVVPECLFAIGIKVSTTDVIGVATDISAGILATSHLPISSTEYSSVIEAITTVEARLRSELGSRWDRLAGIGVSVSGDVDSAGGIVRASALLGWTDKPLGADLHARFGRDVLVENDVRALTIAEHWFGLGVGTASFAIVTIGSGIGCGLHVNGEVVEGAFGVAGEIGHLPLTSPDHICTCGRRGCVEAVASSSAIVRAASAGLDRPDFTLQDAVRLAHEGNPTAAAAFDRAGTVIGRAIATMVNLAGPQLVLIAGEGVAEYDLYDQRLREAFAEHAFGAAANCSIVIRPHAFEDWARGAATAVIRALVTQRYPLRPRVARTQGATSSS